MAMIKMRWLCAYESKLELSRSFNGDGGLDTELELLATLCRDPPVDCISTTYINVPQWEEIDFFFF